MYRLGIRHGSECDISRNDQASGDVTIYLGPDET